MTCPACNGKGQVVAMVDYRDRSKSGPKVLACLTCGGTGEITDEHHARRESGERLRTRRIALGLSIRELAERIGMKPSELSHIEAGREDDADHAVDLILGSLEGKL